MTSEACGKADRAKGEGGGLGIGDTREGLGAPAVSAPVRLHFLSHPRDCQVTVRAQNPLEPLEWSAVWLVEGPREAPFGDISGWLCGCLGGC